MAKDIPTLRDAEEAYESGDIETTLAICDGLIGEDESKAEPEVLYLAGECLLEMQEEVEALHFFELALEQDPQNPLLLHCRGLCLFELGRPKEAKPLFEKARAEAPELAEPVFYLGLLEERANNRDAAQRLFAAAVELDPENFVMPIAWGDEAIKAAFDNMVEEIPEPLSVWLAGLPVVVEQAPPASMLVREGSPISPLVHCLFVGTPSEGPEGDAPSAWLSARPEQVFLYSDNLGKSAQNEYELTREVSEAVLWEVMEFLSLDEDQLETLGVMSEDIEEDDEELSPSGG